MSGVKTRNRCFDLIKGIACIAVVFMHCEFPGMFGTLVQAVARWSVPLFFAVSGYFFRRETTEDCRRKAVHIVRITVGAVIFYILFGILYHLALGDLAAYTSSEVTITNVAAFVLFNSPVFINGHIWFLFALIYVYLSTALMIRLRLYPKLEKPLCIGLMVMHFALAYGCYIAGYKLQGGFYRNWIFEGIPFFFAGNLFYKATADFGEEKKERMKLPSILLIFGGIALSIVERLIIGRDFSVHISSVIVLFGLMMFALRGKEPKGAKPLIRLGEVYSLYVYIVHPAIYLTWDLITEKLFENSVMPWIRPIVTVVISILISVCIVRLTQNRKGRTTQ